MYLQAISIWLYAPWVHSLKEKRSEIKSLLAKLRNKFNVSAAEIQQQDIHQTLVIGIACVAADSKQGEKILQNAVRFIEANTQAEITAIEPYY